MKKEEWDKLTSEDKAAMFDSDPWGYTIAALLNVVAAVVVLGFIWLVLEIVWNLLA